MIDVGTDRKGHSLRMLTSDALKAYSTRKLFQFLEDRDVIVRSSAARHLQLRGGKDVFDFARQLLSNKRAPSREVAAFLLGQLGTPKRPFRTESTKLLIDLLKSETDVQVIAAAIASLGQLRAINAVQQLISYANDRSPAVRASIAFAIGYAHAQESGGIPLKFEKVLRKLRKDRSRTVRDSAELAMDLRNVSSVSKGVGSISKRAF